MDYAEERRLNSPDAVRESRLVREKKQLKTDLKQSTAFCKRVPAISEDSALAMAKDVTTGDKLNLNKFVEEIVISLSKAPLKMKDLVNCTVFCSHMHRLYGEFMDPLVVVLGEQFEQTFKSNLGSKPDFARRRVLLRWFAEMYVSGLVSDQAFVSRLRMATRQGSAPGPLSESGQDPFPLPDQALASLGALQLCCKQLGQQLFWGEAKPRITALLVNYVEMSLVRLGLETDQIKKLKSKLNQDSLKRGVEPTVEQTELLERRERNVEDMHQFCMLACGLLGLPSPPALTLQDELNEDELAREEKGLELWSSSRKRGENGGELSLDAWVFGDEVSRSFYQDIDDLQQLVPRMILDRPDQALQPDSLLLNPTTLSVEEETVLEEGGEVEEGELGEEEDVGGGGDEEEEEEGTVSNNTKQQQQQAMESVARPVEELISRLPNLLSVRQVESFARDFAHVNSKSARKRLVQELVNVPWGRTELLPYYARLACMLSNAYMGIGKPLVDNVRSSYAKAAKDKRPGSRMSSRVRYAKYLGELVKFGLRFPNLACPPAAAFLALKQTFNTFQGENIDMCCILLETCGRELYRFPKTHGEMSRLLEIVQRLKQNKMMSPVQDVTIENAYFHCIPTTSESFKARARRPRGEVEQYVRYLLLERLGRNDLQPQQQRQRETRAQTLQRQTNDTVCALLTLPWDTAYIECELAVCLAVLASSKSRVGSLPLVCLALAQLTKSYPNLSVLVQDRLLERVYAGLESNDSRLNQQRIGQARLLGQLVRQGLVKEHVYFDVLFACLHWGHERAPTAAGTLACDFANASHFHPSVPCLPSDPPYDAFRVRLVCAALESASDRVILPANLGKLELFLTYLDRYVWTKAYFPLEVEFVLVDCLRELERRHLQWKQKRTTFHAPKARGKAKATKLEEGVVGAQFVGRCPSLQHAEDAVAKAEGRGLHPSPLSASAPIQEEEGEEEDEDEGDDDDDNQEEEEADEEDDDGEQSSEGFENRQQVPKMPAQTLGVDDREPSAEDIAFEHEFAKLMKDTLEQSGRSNLAGTAAARGDNLVIPLGIAKRPSQAPGDAATTVLRLVKRTQGGRKVEARDLAVPTTSLLAKSSSSSTSREEKEREEKEAMKRLTLANTMRMRQEGN
ncbi:hypothetical protein BASA81_008089 [Batrachochytrium salamandrivorans]|nr:hypothetical protein BASA81_008089 [Batrachochytrium salamandrivorans]